MRRLLLLTLLALVVPVQAHAGLATLQVREVPLHGERALSAAGAAAPFQLVGVQWRGTGRVELRTRSAAGRWSAWRAAVADDHEGPDPRTPEARRSAAWRTSAPTWVGAAVAVQVRVAGKVDRARTLLVRSPVSRVPLRSEAVAGVPQIVPRSVWQADETIRRAKPEYADALRMAHVHHTAGTNAYTRAQAPAVVRAIQLYHVKGNGWNDIGYNALVDRFGTVYEGRFGGIDRNVIGAHAGGFNTGSFGVAVLGDFRTVATPTAAVDALVKTLAWRLDLGHVDPLGTLTTTSGGNERFGAGVPVFLRALSGHRDSSLTTCPGEKLYGQIPAIAKRVAALGLPKIYAPVATADETGGPRLTAKLSSSLPWSAVVVDGAGVELARTAGTGTRVDWTWLPQGPVTAGTRWRIETPGATPAEGAFAATAQGALQLTGATASPTTISPNGDGQADSTTVSYTLTANANVTVSVVDAAGAAVAELEPRTWRRAGARTVVFDGGGLPDGAYVVRIVANATAGRAATTDVPVTVTRLLGRIALSAPALTPNGDGRDDVLSLTVPLAAPSTVSVRILKEGRWVATPLTGVYGAGELVATWDGSKRLGTALDGAYVAAVEATTADGATSARVELPFLVDARAPAVRVVSAVPPRLHVSEPATLRLRVNGARRVLRVEAPGTVRIPRIERLRTLVVTARDTAGNESILRR
jgi:hypothetical protein